MTKYKEMSKDNEWELQLLNRLYANGTINDQNLSYITHIVIDGIEDAIAKTNIKKSISLIVKYHPNLIPSLKEVLEKDYPEYVDFLDKMLVLV